MNKDLLEQLSPEERTAAEKLSAAAEMMTLSQSFHSDLETRIMDAYPSNRNQRSPIQFLKPIGWAITAIAGVLLANWLFRSLLPGLQTTTPTQAVSFAASVKQGTLCAAPLAVSHGFAVFLTRPDKTQFAVVDAGETIGEMRSFIWSADGNQLSILGNTTGSGNLYTADAGTGQVEPLLAPGELPYMMDAAWSRDGKQIAMWSTHNNSILYIMNADGTGLSERNLQNTHISGAPQFSPDGDSVLFFGSSSAAFGLFQLNLDDSEPQLIVPFVESAGSFAFSPDGVYLAYVEYDHELGEARLMIQDLASGERTLLGSFLIPKGSGSSVPQTANMSWSADGQSIVFDVGRGANDRVIYLAHVDRSGLVKVVDSGYAPAISSDGNCLAYIQDQHLMLLDLRAASNSTAPLLLADLPAGRSNPVYQLDRLKWSPEP